jgi:hypothetical protein
MAKKKVSTKSRHKAADLDSNDNLDGAWKEIGLAAPARRALIDAKLLQVSDLRKVSLDKLKALHGMGPNAIRILVLEMKKRDISFRTGK